MTSEGSPPRIRLPAKGTRERGTHMGKPHDCQEEHCVRIEAKPKEPQPMERDDWRVSIAAEVWSETDHPVVLQRVGARVITRHLNGSPVADALFYTEEDPECLAPCSKVKRECSVVLQMDPTRYSGEAQRLEFEVWADFRYRGKQYETPRGKCTEVLPGKLSP